ncbi:AraC family transcriptional regulator [Paenibacillus rigui]|uniref:HTH araC/xylS-type domain-containing protein n=1 Tax=Paenibacillus rigui TaxID=554312 RepID=A0A229UL25_9BACL|nr:AraC family transcriptional regulator [Paenibacillus rigui]OXM84157.1 hypothetical protein CF651_22235 [Paenibacillus rigui]
MVDMNRLHLHIRWVLDKPTASGWTDKRNNTDAHTLYWIHEGKGIFTTDQAFPVEGGMMAYMRPGLQMDMRSDERYPLQMTMILFDCAEVGYDVRWTEIMPIAELELPFLKPFHTDKSKALGLRFRDLYRSWVPGVQGGALLPQLKLTGLLYELLLPSNGDTGSEGAESAGQALERVKEYLESSYNMDFTIHELAERFHISVSYLRKMFHKTVGMSPKHYHSHIRNEHARHYLMYSELPVKAIAKACGYMEEYHFSKSFKQMNGISPSGFRLQYMATKEGQPAGQTAKDESD